MPYTINDKTTYDRLNRKKPVDTAKVRAAQNAQPSRMSQYIKQDIDTVTGAIKQLPKESTFPRDMLMRGKPRPETQGTSQPAVPRDIELKPSHTQRSGISPGGTRNISPNTSLLKKQQLVPDRGQRSQLSPVLGTNPDPGYEVEVIRGLNRSRTTYGANEDGSWGDPIRSVDYMKMPGMGERLVYDSTDPAYDMGLQYHQNQRQELMKEMIRSAPKASGPDQFTAGKSELAYRQKAVEALGELATPEERAMADKQASLDFKHETGQLIRGVSPDGDIVYREVNGSAVYDAQGNDITSEFRQPPPSQTPPPSRNNQNDQVSMNYGNQIEKGRNIAANTRSRYQKLSSWFDDIG